MSVWDLLASLACVPVALVCGYLGFLAVVARRTPSPHRKEPCWKLDVIVPAHNEEGGIAATVESLRNVDYPEALRHIWVVADNCQDGTAERAQAAGARVLVRMDLEHRGKGYALDHAFRASKADGFADAVVVVDADTTVSPNLLRAFATHLDDGAQAVQASYGVRNPNASWRTRLMTIALALFNDLRSLARERLRWSSGLRGNGMCFTHTLLQDVPHHAYSRVEDLEYGIRIGRAGHRVHFASEAQVWGEMVSSEQASRSQRRRWEGGRFELARRDALPLLGEALHQRKGMLLDLALDLLVPPLSYVALGALLVTAFALVAGWALGSIRLVCLPLAALSDLLLAFYVLRGWHLSGVGARGLLDLLWAPAYILWKVTLLWSRPEHASTEWVRTQREEESRNHGS